MLVAESIGSPMTPAIAISRETAGVRPTFAHARLFCADRMVATLLPRPAFGRHKWQAVAADALWTIVSTWLLAGTPKKCFVVFASSSNRFHR